MFAKAGLGHAAPNPLVGSVVVHDGLIIGEGYHQQFGEAHAEVNAIRSVKDKSLLKESTIYVNLEPCAHFGKTPPCANLIIESNIPKVVIGCVDTFSEVAGKGIEKMKKAGIEVITGVLEKESREINKRFFTFHEQKRPYIILKWAQSVDGFIAPTPDFHESERWISAKETQMLVHKWRAEEQGILVGANTVVKDNPSLTVREFAGKNPTRFVINQTLNAIQTDLSILNDQADTVIYNAVKDEKENHITYKKLDFKVSILPQILNDMYNRNILSVIIEGGAQTLQSFIDSELVDEIRMIQGNNILGDGIKAPINKIEGEVRSFNYGVDQVFISRF